MGLRRNNTPDDGFTLVELLIVIVVIAILAAIAINVFSGVQERARLTKATTDMKSIQKTVELARISTGKTLLEITGEDWTEIRGVIRICLMKMKVHRMAIHAYLTTFLALGPTTRLLVMIYS